MNLAVRALQALDVDPTDIRTELDARLSANRKEPPAAGEGAEQSALDPRARRALELATSEALALGHNFIGSEAPAPWSRRRARRHRRRGAPQHGRRAPYPPAAPW